MYTLSPQVDTVMRTAMTTWLVTTLTSENLDNRSRFPWVGRGPLTLYNQNNGTSEGVSVQGGTWQRGSGLVYLANTGTSMIPTERLEVLVGLLPIANESEALTRAVTRAITKVMLGQYESLTRGLITSTQRAERIAFSPAGGLFGGQVAAFIGGGWHLPDGSAVEVGDGWTICSLNNGPAVPVAATA